MVQCTPVITDGSTGIAESYTYAGVRDAAPILPRGQHAGVANWKQPILPLGYRDRKGKGATDMYYIEKRPIKEIQQVLGHVSKSTTEIYIKQRWRQTAEPNTAVMA